MGFVFMTCYAAYNYNLKHSSFNFNYIFKEDMKYKCGQHSQFFLLFLAMFLLSIFMLLLNFGDFYPLVNCYLMGFPIVWNISAML